MIDNNDDLDLFKNEMAGVKPLADSNRADCNISKPEIKITRKEIDEEKIAESFFDNISESEMMDAGESLYYCRPGLQKKVMRNLKKGQYYIDDEIDLHGMTIDVAKRELSGFIRTTIGDKVKCVLVIHGKGYHSQERAAALKSMANVWLRRNNNILGFCSARIEDGGTGAIYALIRKRQD